MAASDLANDIAPLIRGWVLADGSPVYHRFTNVEGSTPIVHCHGFAISGEYMIPTARVLTDSHTTAVPDLPGFGQSPRGDDFSIDGLAERLRSYVDALDLDRIVLVGNSLGCPITLAFSLRYPERIAGLVLCSPAGGPHNQPLLRAAIQLAMDGPREPVSMARVAVPDYVHFGIVPTVSLFRAMCAYDSFHALRRVSVPTLAILGARDPLLPPAARVREAAASLAAHVTAVVIKQAAHAINYSHPDEVAAIIDQWLSGAPITGAPHGSPVAVLRDSPDRPT